MSSIAELAAAQEVRNGSRAYVQLAVARFLAGAGDVAQTFRKRNQRSLAADRVERAFKIRAAVPGGTQDPDNWAGPLSEQDRLFSGEFTAALRPQTVLGKLPYQTAPLDVRLPLYTAGSAPARWVPPGGAIPVRRATLGSASLPAYKLATITATTKELVTSTSLDAVGLLEADLKAAIVEGRDEVLLDPTLDMVELERPASITNGAHTIPSSGTDAAAIQADAEALLAYLLAAGSNLSSAAFITSQAAGLHLGGLRDPSGALAFPGAGALGGQLLGLPLITSASAGPQLVAIDASQLAVADEGIETTFSQAGALEMDDEPTADMSVPIRAASLVSLFQTNTVAVRCVNALSWLMLRPAAVAVVSGFPEAG